MRYAVDPQELLHRSLRQDKHDILRYPAVAFKGLSNQTKVSRYTQQPYAPSLLDSKTDRIAVEGFRL